MAQRPPPSQRMEGPTVWQKMKMGGMMGAGVGLTIGFLFGSYSILRNGAGPRGVMATLSQYMLGSAASFTFFLSIGSVIRNDSRTLDWQQQRPAPPVVHSTISGVSLIKARWEAEKHWQKQKRDGGM